jgi:hypothetical protein
MSEITIEPTAHAPSRKSPMRPGRQRTLTRSLYSARRTEALPRTAPSSFLQAFGENDDEMLTKATMLAAPIRLPALRLSQLLVGAFLILALAGFGFMLFEVHAMRTGLEATNAALARTNAQLERTNRGVAAMGQQLALTNRLLVGMRGQLGTTNGQLSVTNAKLSLTNAKLSLTNSKLSSTNAQLSATNVQLRAMAHKITHAKLLF